MAQTSTPKDEPPPFASTTTMNLHRTPPRSKEVTYRSMALKAGSSRSHHRFSDLQSPHEAATFDSMMSILQSPSPIRKPQPPPPSRAMSSSSSLLSNNKNPQPLAFEEETQSNDDDTNKEQQSPPLRLLDLENNTPSNNNDRAENAIISSSKNSSEPQRPAMLQDVSMHSSVVVLDDFQTPRQQDGQGQDATTRTPFARGSGSSRSSASSQYATPPLSSSSSRLSSLAAHTFSSRCRRSSNSPPNGSAVEVRPQPTSCRRSCCTPSTHSTAPSISHRGHSGAAALASKSTTSSSNNSSSRADLLRKGSNGKQRRASATSDPERSSTSTNSVPRGSAMTRGDDAVTTTTPDNAPSVTMSTDEFTPPLVDAQRVLLTSPFSSLFPTALTTHEPPQNTMSSRTSQDRCRRRRRQTWTHAAATTTMTRRENNRPLHATANTKAMRRASSLDATTSKTLSNNNEAPPILDAFDNTNCLTLTNGWIGRTSLGDARRGVQQTSQHALHTTARTTVATTTNDDNKTNNKKKQPLLHRLSTVRAAQRAHLAVVVAVPTGVTLDEDDEDSTSSSSSDESPTPTLTPRQVVICVPTKAQHGSTTEPLDFDADDTDGAASVEHTPNRIRRLSSQPRSASVASSPLTCSVTSRHCPYPYGSSSSLFDSDTDDDDDKSTEEHVVIALSSPNSSSSARDHYMGSKHELETNNDKNDVVGVTSELAPATPLPLMESDPVVSVRHDAEPNGSGPSPPRSLGAESSPRLSKKYHAAADTDVATDYNSLGSSVHSDCHSQKERTASIQTFHQPDQPESEGSSESLCPYEASIHSKCPSVKEGMPSIRPFVEPDQRESKVSESFLLDDEPQCWPSSQNVEKTLVDEPIENSGVWKTLIVLKDGKDNDSTERVFQSRNNVVHPLQSPVDADATSYGNRSMLVSKDHFKDAHIPLSIQTEIAVGKTKDVNVSNPESGRSANTVDTTQFEEDVLHAYDSMKDDDDDEGAMDLKTSPTIEEECPILQSTMKDFESFDYRAEFMSPTEALPSRRTVDVTQLPPPLFLDETKAASRLSMTSLASEHVIIPQLESPSPHSVVHRQSLNSLASDNGLVPIIELPRDSETSVEAAGSLMDLSLPQSTPEAEAPSTSYDCLRSYLSPNEVVPVRRRRRRLSITFPSQEHRNDSGDAASARSVENIENTDMKVEGTDCLLASDKHSIDGNERESDDETSCADDKFVVAQLEGKTLLQTLREEPLEGCGRPELIDLEEYRRLMIENQSLQDKLHAAYSAHEDRLTPFRDLFQEHRKLKEENEQLASEKITSDNMGLAMQKKNQAALSLLMQKTHLIQTKSKKIASLEESLRRARDEISALRATRNSLGLR